MQGNGLMQVLEEHDRVIFLFADMQGYSEMCKDSTKMGAGIPEERVKEYEEGIKKGGILMGVKPRTPEDADYFEQDWKSNRGEHVYR